MTASSDRQPLAPVSAAGALARLPARVRPLAEGLIGDDAVRLVLRTRTKADVGQWFLRGRVWLVALDEALVLTAAVWGGPRPLAERIEYTRLRESRYNHVTGQLALSPATVAGVRGLSLGPIEGRQVLAEIYRER